MVRRHADAASFLELLLVGAEHKKLSAGRARKRNVGQVSSTHGFSQPQTR
jgi:hypothetical protein